MAELEICTVRTYCTVPDQGVLYPAIIVFIYCKIGQPKTAKMNSTLSCRSSFGLMLFSSDSQYVRSNHSGTLPEFGLYPVM